MRARRVVAVLAGGLILGLTACGSGGSGGEAGVTTTTIQHSVKWLANEACNRAANDGLAGQALADAQADCRFQTKRLEGPIYSGPGDGSDYVNEQRRIETDRRRAEGW